MRETKEAQRGITLIALVVTIIVLLILAGISIAMLTGDNGLLNRAKDSVDAYTIAEEKEKIQLCVLQAQMNKESGSITFAEIAVELINNGIATEEGIDETNQIVITKAGTGFLLSLDSQRKWKIENISTTEIYASSEVLPDNQETPVATIKIKAVQMKDGIEKIILPDGNEVVSEDEKAIIFETEYDVISNGTYTFKVVANGGEEKEHDVLVNNISADSISIVPSTEDWTTQAVTVKINWPVNSDTLIKEYTKDGIKWDTYNGEFEVSSNCTVKARLIKGTTLVRDAEKTIGNIDTDAPNGTITLAQYISGDVSWGIDSTVTVDDGTGIGADYSKCKYKITNDSTELGTIEDLYTDGNITSASTTIQKAKTEGTYFLHVLLVDKLGNKQELVSANSVSVVAKKDFSYIGDSQSVSLLPGTYKLEVWGAEGGYRNSATYSGKGGYSVGNINLTSQTLMYAYVGGSGNSVTTANSGIYAGGFNGGGYRYGYRGGGGASDIRIASDSLYARVIVAGGGGSDGATSKHGYYGGGETGGSSSESYTANSNYCGKGGTQSYSGYSISYTITSQAKTGLNTNSTANYCGGFGFGRRWSLFIKRIWRCWRRWLVPEVLGQFLMALEMTTEAEAEALAGCIQKLTSIHGKMEMQQMQANIHLTQHII